MLRPRIIPCLLVHDGGLVKTVKFSDPTYVGDPINAVRIFNEKEADELMVIDIDATVNGSEPDYKMITDLAVECRMPLCYGGGVNNADQARHIISIGVEKVAISSAAVASPDCISVISNAVGRQSVVVVIDVKKRKFSNVHDVYIRNGKEKTGLTALDFAETMQKAGAGEIVINSVERDGTMQGYDLALAKQLRERVNIPITFLGGASSLDNIVQLVDTVGPCGAAAGSLFVFKGKYRAVLINYPDPEKKENLLCHSEFKPLTDQ